MEQAISWEYCKQATEEFKPEKYDYFAVVEYLLKSEGVI